MALFRIHFTYEKKEFILLARSLDMTHPYFVSIKDIELPKSSDLIIDPNRDTLEKHFGDSYHIMIPFQSVSLIEELREGGKHAREPKSYLNMVTDASKENE